MSLTVALNNALTGIQMNQRALAVTSNNIANANTEGYSRQELNLSSLNLDGVGAGVQIDGIARKVDEYLQTSIRSQSSTVGESSVVAEFMERVQILLGDPGADNSLDKYTANFFDAIQTLAETPDRSSFRTNAVQSANTLAREVSLLAADLEEMRFTADRRIYTATREVNQMIESLYSVNVALNASHALGTSNATLLDERDQLLEEIAEHIQVDTYEEPSGAVQVYTNNGATLLDEYAHSIRFTPSQSVTAFTTDQPVGAMDVVILNENGQIISTPEVLTIEGVEGGVSSRVSTGSIAGLQEIRDIIIPEIIGQLDEFASTLRDAFNTIHNAGSSYPGATELTASRSAGPKERTEWSGEVTIAVLDEDGMPANSAFSNETETGFRPLNLDLSFLDSGYGAGNFNMQTLVNEINNHFVAPEIKSTLGSVNNIQLVSDTNALPDIPAIFNFDLDLENISAFDSDVFLTNITVLDDTGADITLVSTPQPKITFDALSTFNTTIGTGLITINAAGHGLAEGERIFIDDPAVPINGIASTQFGRYFEVTNVTANGFDIQMPSNVVATATGPVGVAATGATVITDTIAAGDKARTRDIATMGVDLGGNTTSQYYDITIDVGVDDKEGEVDDIKTSQITYRVYNFGKDMLNDRYNNTAANGDAERLIPANNYEYITATLVDADGVELPKTNGVYASANEGFLKLQAGDGYTVVIDESTSKQLGSISQEPIEVGTNQGFSNYFGLNNFFESHEHTLTGDTTNGSALSLQVEQRIVDAPYLLSTGTLTRSPQPTDPDATPLYTSEITIGDNSIAQRLAALGIQNINFDAAGAIAASSQSFSGFLSEVIAYNSAEANRYDTKNNDNTIVLDGYTERSDSFSGVNIDEELANTILYQNAYAASARIITTTNELFETLLNSF